jgi:hypothetical protein
MNARAVLPTSLLTLALLAGCGGDDGPTREEFAAEANRVCQEVNRAGERLGTPDNPGEIVSFVDEANRTVDRGVQRLRDLETPEGEDGERAEQFVAAVEREANEQLKPALRDLRAAAERRDVDALQTAAERVQNVSTEESDRLAREIGADACAD